MSTIVLKWRIENTFVAKYFGVPVHKAIWEKYFEGKIKSMIRMLLFIASLVFNVIGLVEAIPRELFYLGIVYSSLYYVAAILLQFDLELVKACVKTYYFQLNYWVIIGGMTSLCVTMGFDYRAWALVSYAICFFGLMLMDTVPKNCRRAVAHLPMILPVMLQATLIILVSLSRIPRFDSIKFTLGDFGGAAATQLEYSVAQLTLSLLFAGLTFSVYNMLHHFKSKDEIQYIITYAKVEEDEECYIFAFLGKEKENNEGGVSTQV